MEKAIIKTLIYADIFDYPLTFKELHKWLIGRKTEPRKMEKSLNKVNNNSRIMNNGEYYFFLIGRKGVVRKRKGRQRYSHIYIRKAKMVSWFLKLIPWVKLVGISGGLAMENAGKADDIDLFIITSKNRLWLSRILILGVLEIMGQRRKKTDSKKSSAGKICCNIILEEDHLVQKTKDLYTAHEVLQMKVLWQRNGMYSKYLSDNAWVFKYLPNWIASPNQDLRLKISDFRKRKKSLIINQNSVINLIEEFTKWLQLKHIGKPKGMERVQDGAVYFHPKDYRDKVLKEYKKQLTVLDKKR